MPDDPKLWRRLFWRGCVGLILFATLVFVPARTFKFWQAWVLMAVNSIASACIAIYFYRRDPQVLQRRMLAKEKVPAQRIILAVWRVFAILSLVEAGLDHRIGLSRAYLAPVPLWLEWLSLGFLVGAHVLFFEVLQANRFAASVIHVEAGQTVMASGLYRFVRHPMYVAFLVMGLFTPLALGSFVALGWAVFILPVVVFRLLNEEKILRRELPGYPDYCERTRHRLVPNVW